MERLRKKMRKDEVDRLSSLPDSVLVSILNRLPIDSAATTSVLSRHWRYLWTQLNYIDFPPPDKFDKYTSYDYFVTTVDHILSKLTASIIHRFTLVIPSVGDPKSSTFLLPWISKICGLNPKTIKLCWTVPDARYPFHLPSCIFQTQSLLSLELYGALKCEFMLPNDGINLPNLRELRVLFDSQIPFLETLFKSCPLLAKVNLVLSLKDKGHVVDISAPNLKCLIIACQGRDCTFVIAMPKLEYGGFKGRGQLPFFQFVNNPICLWNFCVDARDLVQGYEDTLSRVQGLFQQISCISSLDLGKSSPCLLETLCHITLPIFHNLVHLHLHSVNIDGSSRVPLGLLHKVKKITFSELVGNLPEMKFLEYVFGDAPVLKELCVFFCEVHNDGREPEPDQFFAEYKFCKDLFLLLRSSLRCKIKFSGKRITASSNDFRTDVITYQIKSGNC